MSFKTITLYSPVKGNLIDISKVPDEAFAQKILGDGIAVIPQENFICAPADSFVKNIHKSLHAIVLERDGFEILIHIGVDTVTLKGQGFKAFVKEGDFVKQGQKLIEFDRDYISQNAPSDAIMMVIATPLKVTLTKEKITSVSEETKVFTAFRLEGQVQKNNTILDGKIYTQDVTISNKTGLHARPAGEVATLAQSFKNTNITLVKGQNQANAKSMVEILGLSLEYGDTVQIKATGEDAEFVTLEIKNFILRELKDSLIQEQPTKEVNNDGELKFKGIGIFDGLAIGKAYVLNDFEFDIEEKSKLPVAEELKKFEASLRHVKSSLDKERHAIYGQKDREEILLAHITILEDPFLIQETEQLIEKGFTSAFAFSTAIKRAVDVLKKAGSSILRARVADFMDLQTRVISDLTGINYGLPKFSEDTVIITKELLSHHLNDLNGHIAGIVMAEGSALSHVSIMLKTLGIPAVIGVGHEILETKNGSDIIIDSKLGIVTVNPKNIEEIKQKTESLKVYRQENLSHALEPAFTKDGVEITVSGNIGNLEQARQSVQQGGKGIGLVRTEFLFATSQKEPTEQEQYEIYQKIVDLQNGNPVIIRTLDVGADKPIPFVPQIKEENPILGRRGIRTSFTNIEMLKTQLRAIMRVKPYGIAKIMIPMVTFIEEMSTVSRFVKEEQEKLGIDKVSLGMMVEVPAAALMTSEFAKIVDFFSIGTNDLTQYTLALDRAHPTLNFLSDTLNPAVLQMIDITVQGAKSENKPVGVCGAIASEPAGAILLIGLGIRALSVVPSSIADIKALIRRIDVKHCEQIAQKALHCKSVGEVRNMVNEEFDL
ncbi:MAG: phosphoenolpyruvate--protein phosphotransferase [Elusimicrobiaceae bacterium]|nr:phosphoenolpyruvate--protein phosphotransferase [Elusimicrobiaceae bacterium]